MTTPTPWWTCPHTGIGMPDCPTCDPRLTDGARAALRLAREEIGRLQAERDRLARIFAVERGDESQAPEGWRRPIEPFDCEWELVPYDDDDGPEWAIQRVIWTDGLPRWMFWGPHAQGPMNRVTHRTALEAMEAADLARAGGAS